MKTEPTFNFDLARMKKAVEAPYYIKPKDQTFEEFVEWAKNLDTDDKYIVKT